MWMFILSLTALVIAVVPLPAEWVERTYSTTTYLTAQRYITSASNHTPVALLDLFVAGVLMLIAAGLVRDRRAGGWRRALTGGVRRALLVAVAGYLVFVLSWGLNYRRVPLETKLAFDPGQVTPTAARDLAALAIARLNDGYSAAHPGAVDWTELEASFAVTQRLLGASRLATLGRPKASLAGLYFRAAGIDGMTVPGPLEIILNPDLLPVEYPSVLTHEWAHLAGYADESEANFVAWVTVVRSDDPVARYSAWLDAYALAMRVLPRDVGATLPPLAEGPRADLRAIAARRAQSLPVVRTAAREVYDTYLKANRVEEGIASYDAALELILGTALGQRASREVPQRGQSGVRPRSDPRGSDHGLTPLRHRPPASILLNGGPEG